MPAARAKNVEKGVRMPSGKLSYTGIAGAVAGIVGLFGIYAKWFSVQVAGGIVKLDGTADASGKLALAMSIALFAFSVTYVLMDDARIRRSMGALIIATSVILTLAVLWGVARGDGLEPEMGLWLSGLGGLLGICAGLLSMKESPLGGDLADPPLPDSTPSDVPASTAP
jgi:hypothetical protein